MNAGKLDALSHIPPTLVIHVQNYSWTGLFPVKHRWNRKEWWQGCFLLCVKYSGIYPCHRSFSVQQNIHWNGTIVQKEMLVNLHLLRISNHPKKIVNIFSFLISVNISHRLKTEQWMICVFQSKKFRVGILTAPSSSLIKEFRARSADNAENREFIPRELPQACSKQPPSATMYTRNLQEVNVTRFVTKKPIPFSVEYTIIKNCTIYLNYYLNHVYVICIFTWKSLSYTCTTCGKPLFDGIVSKAMTMFHLFCYCPWFGYIWQRNFKPTGNTMNVLSLLHFEEIFFKRPKEV